MGRAFRFRRGRGWESRFLHCAVAVAPAPVGMTKLFLSLSFRSLVGMTKVSCRIRSGFGRNDNVFEGQEDETLGEVWEL
jgi:hypothetical protein